MKQLLRILLAAIGILAIVAVAAVVYVTTFLDPEDFKPRLTAVVEEQSAVRGVGSRLMALLGEQAKQEGRVLRIATTTLPLADRMLLSKLGYRPVADSSPESDQQATSEFVELDPQGKG